MTWPCRTRSSRNQAPSCLLEFTIHHFQPSKPIDSSTVLFYHGFKARPSSRAWHQVCPWRHDHLCLEISFIDHWAYSFINYRLGNRCAFGINLERTGCSIWQNCANLAREHCKYFETFPCSLAEKWQDQNKAAEDPNLQYLASQGITLTNYYATTHPSEP